MTSTFLIRDGLESDIAACLALDHRYETDFVWQTSIGQDASGWQILFKKERLPRTLEGEYRSSEHRLRATLPTDQCFLVASERTTEITEEGEAVNSHLLGYLSMRREPSRGVGWIQDFVVDAPVRRAKIGSRLFKVARAWALEHDLTRLMVETDTRNTPAIQFCNALGFAFCGYNDRYFDHQDIAIFLGQNLR
jgi:GNAT superfamily N-acetyltransferase